MLECLTYLEDDTADGSSSLSSLHWLRHVAALSKCLVSDAVVEIESSLGDSLDIIEFHNALSILFKNLVINLLIKSFSTLFRK